MDKRKNKLIIILLVIILVVLAVGGLIFIQIKNSSDNNEKEQEENVLTTGKTLVQMYLDGNLKVGDYINYIPDAISTLYDVDEGNEAGTLTGLKDQIAQNSVYLDATTGKQIISQEQLKWRVLGYDEENNQLLIISEKPTDNTIVFCGYTGYNNYENILNNTCKYLYSKSQVGIARNITMKDVDTYLGGNSIDKTKLINDQLMDTFGYGAEIKCENIYHPKQWDGKWSGTIISNAFFYRIEDYIESNINKELLGNNEEWNSYWLATCSVLTNSSDWIRWGGSYIGNGQVNAYTNECFCYYEPYHELPVSVSSIVGEPYECCSDEYNLSLRPIVSINSDVTMEQLQKKEEIKDKPQSIGSSQETNENNSNENGEQQTENSDDYVVLYNGLNIEKTIGSYSWGYEEPNQNDTRVYYNYRKGKYIGETVGVSFKDESDLPQISISKKYQAIPRKYEIISAIPEKLGFLENKDDVVNLEINRIDLDGDAREEYLCSYTIEYKTGDYSDMYEYELLKSHVDILDNDYNRISSLIHLESDSDVYLSLEKHAEYIDIDNDGIMEILIEIPGWEGIGLEVFKYSNNQIYGNTGADYYASWRHGA